MLQGRVALVTGGGRGIGAAITAALAQDGAHVAAGYSRDRDSAEQLAADLRSKGLSVSTHQGNVGNPDDCKRVAEEVIDGYDRIDILVNNAGVNVDKTVRKMTVEDWHAVLRINLSGAFYMTKAVLDGMLERGFGRIVNMSSAVGETGSIGQANYAASKSGLFGFTKSLALEAARKGVTVNCVTPGYTATDMLTSVPEPILQKVLERIPTGRLGHPSEVARAVRFLVDDDAGYITGAVLAVNGGLEM
jgi:NAD(P)-dependent dehydrogenase (short-subunit alcohol dehydrogenase family)